MTLTNFFFLIVQVVLLVTLFQFTRNALLTDTVKKTLAPSQGSGPQAGKDPLSKENIIELTLGVFNDTWEKERREKLPFPFLFLFFLGQNISTQLEEKNKKKTITKSIHFSLIYSSSNTFIKHKITHTR